jgi:hypothetical protein
MPVSPQDYERWAAATGNPYPRTQQEKARVAPEVYDYNRGFGKFRGFDEVQGFQQDVVYDQPVAIRHYGDNSLLQSPITPDNNVPKVAGQLNNTLTGQHYAQHYADDASETGYGGTDRPRSLLEKAAIGALGAGAVAAGVYSAQKLSGRDLGVGKIGGMVQDLGRKAKSLLGFGKQAVEPTFATREGAENILSVAQHGTSAIDDVAPGIVRGQNVIPAGVRAQQQVKSKLPDPWYEANAPQTITAPAVQSVVPTQTSTTGVDSDIAARVNAFTKKIGYSNPILETPSTRVETVTPSEVSAIGRFPGPEGSSAAGVTFTPVQGAIEGRPARYTILPRGAATEGAEEAAELTGLLSQQRPVPQGSLTGVQRRFSADPRVATVQKQAENIFQATGDPSSIRSAYSEAPGLPIRVTLPSGESVPTSSLYEPFNPVINPETGIPVVQSRAESLQAALNMQSQMKARALEQLGVPSTYQPTQAQLQSLGPRTERMLRGTAQASEAARNRLAQAEASGMLYKLKPEVTEGIRQVPIISETTGEVVGSRVVPEVQGMPTSEYYQMRARGGAGRQEVGGIGRRREAVEGMGELSFGIAPGSADDVTPVLYKGIDDVTGRVTIFLPEDVSPVQIATGVVTPVRGTAVEPQRTMGREGRTFKGIATNVIDPASFDPALLSEIAKATPERIDPSSGLAYARQAMGGEKAAQRRRQIEALRQSGQRMRGRMGTELPASVVRGGAISESGVDPALGTRFAQRPPAPAGSARAQRIELMRQRDKLVSEALSGKLSPLPQIPNKKVFVASVPKTTQPSGTIKTTREFVPAQLTIPGAGVAPSVGSTPALEEALAVEKYMAGRPSQRLGIALRQALATQNVQQLPLF